MLVLASLPKLLQRALAPPELHTAVLFTAAGALVAYAHAPGPEPDAQLRPKDDVRVLVGLAGEVWAETRADGEGVVDSELGRIVVLPVPSLDKDKGGAGDNAHEKTEEPFLLVALNATDAVEWDKLQDKAHSLATYLAKPLGQLRSKLNPPAPPTGRSSRR